MREELTNSARELRALVCMRKCREIHIIGREKKHLAISFSSFVIILPGTDILSGLIRRARQLLRLLLYTYENEEDEENAET